MRYLFCILLYPLLSTALPAQELLDLAAKNYCQYWGDTIESELYRFEPNESVPQAVQKILGWSGREANFELVQCNVSSVAAVLDGDKRYLLYSQDFFYHVPNALDAYALLAHEIGHHLNGHRFDACCRKGEELEADEFMGRVLFFANFTDLNGAQQFPGWRYEGRGFAHADIVPAPERRAAIARGWKRSDTAVQGRNHLAYYDKENKDNNLQMAGLRAFPWPPPACAERYTVANKLTGRFSTLGDVDNWLRSALDNRKYWSRSYHYLPDGFALVTRLEQFNTDGSSKSDPYRWIDYPANEANGGILDYLYSIFVPRKGYFRIFVFAVTDRPAGSSGQPVDRVEAQKWLENATSNLPYDIAKLPVNERHFVEVLVYEFEATDSNLKANRRCPCIKPCREHLEKAGLLQGLK